jgi:hypothetical protein
VLDLDLVPDGLTCLVGSLLPTGRTSKSPLESHDLSAFEGVRGSRQTFWPVNPCETSILRVASEEKEGISKGVERKLKAISRTRIVRAKYEVNTKSRRG